MLGCVGKEISISSFFFLLDDNITDLLGWVPKQVSMV